MIWFSSLILKINIFSVNKIGVSSFRVSMVWKNLKGKYKAIQKEVVLLIVGLICQTPSSITARGSRRPFHQNAQLMLSLIDWRHPEFNEWDVYILIFFFQNRNIHLCTFLLSKNQARIVNIVF